MAETQDVQVADAASREVGKGLNLLLLILLAFVGSRVWFSRANFYWSDDYPLRYYAEANQLTLEYLFQPYYGHVNPVGNLAAWTLQAAFPGSYGATSTYVTVVQMLGLTCVWMLAIRLTRSTLAGTVASFFVGFSAFSLETTSWWAVATYAAPCASVLAFTLLMLTRALEEPSERHWWVLVIAGYSILCLSHTRGALLWPLIFGFAATVPLPGRSALGVRQAYMLARRMWIGTAAGGFLYTLWLSDITPRVATESFNLTTLVEFAGASLMQSLAPGIVGGPWRFFGMNHQPDPSVTAQWISVVLVVSALTWVVATKAHIRHFLLMIVGYCLALVLMNSAFRHVWNLPPTPYRYLFELAVPIGLGLALACSSVIGGVRRPGTSVAAFVGVGALAVSIGLTTLNVRAALSMVQPVRDYASRGATGLASLPAGTVLIPQATPSKAELGLIPPWASTQVVFAPVVGDDSFGDVAYDKLYGFDQSGSLTEHQVTGESTVTGPEPDCGFALVGSHVVLPLRNPLTPAARMVQLDYWGYGEGRALVRVGETQQEVTITAGPHRAFFWARGAVGSVSIRALSQNTRACVGRAVVGDRVGAVDGTVYDPPFSEINNATPRDFPVPAGATKD